MHAAACHACAVLTAGLSCRAACKAYEDAVVAYHAARAKQLGRIEEGLQQRRDKGWGKVCAHAHIRLMCCVPLSGARCRGVLCVLLGWCPAGCPVCLGCYCF